MDLILSQGSSEDQESLLKEILADLYKTPYIFLFENARTGLFFLLKALGKGGEVITPGYNCVAVPEAVQNAGYEVAFADIDLGTYNIAPESLERSITPGTSAVLITHQFGIPSDIEDILRICKAAGVTAIEDAAPAIGALINGRLVGTFADAAVISFHPGKVLPAGGGGALIVHSRELADRVGGLLRTLPSRRSNFAHLARAIVLKVILDPKIYEVFHLFYRSSLGEDALEAVSHANKCFSAVDRCSKTQAFLANILLKDLSPTLRRRRDIADTYKHALSDIAGLKLPDIPPAFEPSWIHFPVRVQDKKAFCIHMQRSGIDVSRAFSYSCADRYGMDNCPNSRLAAESLVGLPTYPSLQDEHVERICRAVKACPAK
jgi:dTDP-4-amino-4,6-dideoxygalactose transaminase